jgi:transposase
LKQSDIEDGIVAGQTSSEQSEIVQLCRKMRKLKMTREILRRAWAYLTQGSLPEGATRWSVTWPPT